MLLRGRGRLGAGIGMVVLLLFEAPACSAILGIDDLPHAGEGTPLDATGSCEQLRAEMACGQGCEVICMEAGNQCLCPPDGGADGFFGNDVFFGEVGPFESSSPDVTVDSCRDPKGCNTPETSPCTMTPCEGGPPPPESGPPQEAGPGDGGFG